jgi:CubicO group peptidase (beta-lactamase class C family)
MSNFSRLIVCFLLLQGFVKNAQGQTISQAQKIDNYIKQKVAGGKLVGLAVAVVHNDSVIIAKGYGITPDGKVINANTPFAIASLSKAFTATAVLQLAEQGKVSLDSPVIKYIPSFLPNEPRRVKITVRQILHQIGGLADSGYPEFTLNHQPVDLDGAISNLKGAKLVTEPGTAFHYHNPNYQILAKIVETVSGEKFTSYLQKHIFAPLKMVNSYDIENTDQFGAAPQKLPLGNVFFLGRPIPHKEPTWFVDGDAGIISNANDMAQWLSFQLKGSNGDSTEVLGSKFMKIMQNPPPETQFTYGMGWHVDKKDHTLYHSGIMWTYSSQQILFTDSGYGIVALFNGGFDQPTDYYSFLEGIHNILKGEKPETRSLPRWLYTTIVITLLLLIIALGIRRLLRTKQWYHNYKKRKALKTWVYLLLRTVPFTLLLTGPYLVTLASGRVLSGWLITLMFADLVLVLTMLALFNTLIILSRLIYLFRNKGVQLK